MAHSETGTDLQNMFASDVPRVRDGWASYGPHEVDDDEFPAARVLEDLARCSDGAVPRVLARYAALRIWLLREEGADPVTVRHGVKAARAYLAVTEGPEAAALGRLSGDRPGLDAFLEAGAAAAEVGHREGAYALFRAGYTTARRRGDLAGAVLLAEALAEHLGAEQLDGVALWRRRADRLRRRLDQA
jgi:hypothetical protein